MEHKKLPREFSPKEVEKMIFNLYIDMRAGRTYEDKAVKECFILSSYLKAIELDLKSKRLQEIKANKTA
jgi:hypothetical protein